MKKLTNYLLEKYLIDLDTEDPLNINKYYENREPDFIINNKQELLNLDPVINDEFVKYIADCAKMPLLCWKISCNNNNLAGKILKFRKNNNIDILTCKNSIYANDIGFMSIFTDKNTNNVPEIWINRNKHDYMFLLSEKNI